MNFDIVVSTGIGVPAPTNSTQHSRCLMELSQDYLKSVLYYNPETGLFTRLATKSNAAKIGELVGSLNNSGYLRCNINNKLHYMHRLAFLYMTGAFPPEHVDHINGVRHDNRWCNLRAVTLAENNRNIRRKKVNKSGVNGVHWSEQQGKWVAQIKVESKTKHIGAFDSIHAAAGHRKAAEKIHGYHENHGTERK